VRSLLLLFCLIVLAGPLRAQEQEGKLVDRLLKPDLSLANSAQDKKFSGTDATSANKEFVATSFHSGKERSAKPFAGIRDFFAKAFGTRKFSRAEAAANTKASADAARVGVFETKPSSLTRPAPEAKKSARTRVYADQRPFRGKGTRQEILNQQGHPLTIDEVRELLNKNE
jgi:hypothetical protein